MLLKQLLWRYIFAAFFFYFNQSDLSQNAFFLFSLL